MNQMAVGAAKGPLRVSRMSLMLAFVTAVRRRVLFDFAQVYARFGAASLARSFLVFESVPGVVHRRRIDG